MSVLKNTISLMREAETLVVGRTFQPRSRFAFELVDALLHAPWFVLAGMQGLLYVLARGAILALVWGLILYFFAMFDGDGRAEVSAAGLVAGAAFLGVGSILFGLPSGLMARAVSEAHVLKLASYIACSAPDGASINLLRQGVERIEVAGQKRLSAIGAGLGLAWVFLVWLISQWVLVPDVPAPVRSDAASYGVIGFIVFIVFAATFTSYREAHRMLWQTITFAFLEVESMRLRSTEAARQSG